MHLSLRPWHGYEYIASHSLQAVGGRVRYFAGFAQNSASVSATGRFS